MKFNENSWTSNRGIDAPSLMQNYPTILFDDRADETSRAKQRTNNNNNRKKNKCFMALVVMGENSRTKLGINTDTLPNGIRIAPHQAHFSGCGWIIKWSLVVGTTPNFVVLIRSTIYYSITLNTKKNMTERLWWWSNSFQGVLWIILN